MKMNLNENASKLIEKLDVTTFMEILHAIVDDICSLSGSNCENVRKSWTLNDWWLVRDSVQDILKQSVNQNWTKDQILEATGPLSDQMKQCVVDVVQSRKSEIRCHLLRETHSLSSGLLTDFDWKVKLMMSSDKISTVHEPVVSLDLEVTDNARTIHSLELNKDELQQLVQGLEAANKVVQNLKA